MIFKTKTFWTGAVAMVTAVGSYFTGDMAFADMVQTLSIGLIGIFLRQGVITATQDK